MGFFGKIFEKKECANCGKELKLTGWRSLADGYLCKDCTELLSPYFAERKESTTAEILNQLVYRRNNLQVVRAFRADERYGTRPCIEIDRGLNCMMVVRTDDPVRENPDVIDLQTVTDCRLKVNESRREVTYKNAEGKEISYEPKRYRYLYDFDLIIQVDNPYFSTIRLDMSRNSIGGRAADEYYRMAEQCNQVQRALGIAPTPVDPPRMDDPLPPPPPMGMEHGPRGQMNHGPAVPPAPVHPNPPAPPQAPVQANRPAPQVPTGRPGVPVSNAQPHRPSVPQSAAAPKPPVQPEKPGQGGPRGPRG